MNENGNIPILPPNAEWYAEKTKYDELLKAKDAELAQLRHKYDHLLQILTPIKFKVKSLQEDINWIETIEKDLQTEINRTNSSEDDEDPFKDAFFLQVGEMEVNQMPIEIYLSVKFDKMPQ